ncbi:hypothetical protein [uncultured Muribaculum sp.]|uniref:hypothetical protein n=1 Tax=uncultured Muribaculum sp. TaxID=1918613 RepID=UPI002658FCDA|nr:hypothetical protein [uncultured Muribaculum sp.]
MSIEALIPHEVATSVTERLDEVPKLGEVFFGVVIRAGVDFTAVLPMMGNGRTIGVIHHRQLVVRPLVTGRQQQQQLIRVGELQLEAEGSISYILVPHL